MRKLMCVGLIALLALPVATLAASPEEAAIQQLQQQIQKLSAELEALAKKVEEAKQAPPPAPAVVAPAPAPVPATEPVMSEIKDLSKRLDKVERHTVLDRIEFSGDLRYKVHSLHYDDVTYNPGINVNFQDFFEKLTPAAMGSQSGPLGGFVAFNPQVPDFQDLDGNPGPDGIADWGGGLLNPLEMASVNPSPLDAMFASMYSSNPVGYQALFTNFQNWLANGMQGATVMPMALRIPETYDINNDILQTSRLRLNMNARVWDNVKFTGRLSMFKNWGDSTGAQVFDSWNRFTMDATTSGNTADDTIRVDRAYFDWSNIADSGYYLSIGRRPSTGGPPLHYRENELRGGTPTGNVMSLNFDGITIGRNIEDWTGIEGMVARFCYGQGFESEWGNGEMFNEIVTDDTHFAGINLDILNDGTNFLQFTAFRAMDINDGFKGVIAFPTQYGALFAPTLYNDMQKFPNFNFVTRVQPSTTIGDIDLGGIVFSREEENGINWFVSGGMTILRPNNNAGMFGGMGSDAIFEAELNSTGTEVILVPKKATDTDDEEGYGFYAGIQFPAPMGKLGLEYNYGSKWWTPFNQAIDDAIGSKLATRGHVGEAYYIFDINPNMFIKLSGQYYDFEYTGSGSPVGKPQKVDDVKDGTAYSLLPAVDTAYDLNATFTVKF